MFDVRHNVLIQGNCIVYITYIQWHIRIEPPWTVETLRNVVVYRLNSLIFIRKLLLVTISYVIYSSDRVSRRLWIVERNTI